MSYKIDVKAKHIFRDKKAHFIVTKYPIYQEDTVLNVYTPNNVAGCKGTHVLGFRAYKVQKHAQVIGDVGSLLLLGGESLPTQQGSRKCGFSWLPG